MKIIAALTVAFLAPTGSAFAADAKAGEAAYGKSCKGCHGAAGAANPGLAKMLNVTIKDLSSAEVQAESDADLKKVITDGQGKMKPVSSLDGSADDVVAFLRTL